MTIIVDDNLILQSYIQNVKYVGTNKSVTVFCSSTFIRIYANFVKLTENVIIISNTIGMNIFSNTIRNMSIPIANLSLQIECNSFPIYKDKLGRVIKIDNIDLKPSLYYTHNNIDYITKTRTTLNGKLVVFTQKLGRFTKKEQIYTNNDFSLSYNVLKKIQNLINQDKIFNIYFDNGYNCKAKFDVLNKPLEANPIFVGSDMYYVTIRVLI